MKIIHNNVLSDFRRLDRGNDQVSGRKRLLGALRTASINPHMSPLRPDAVPVNFFIQKCRLYHSIPALQGNAPPHTVLTD